MKLIEWPKESAVPSKRIIGARQKSRRYSAKESTVLGKRIVGSQQKNHRCSAKESSVLSKRIVGAKRKQSIYSQISLNCYASGSSNMGQNRLSRKSVGIQLEVEGKTNFVLWQKNISKQ